METEAHQSTKEFVLHLSSIEAVRLKQLCDEYVWSRVLHPYPEREAVAKEISRQISLGELYECKWIKEEDNHA